MTEDERMPGDVRRKACDVNADPGDAACDGELAAAWTRAGRGGASVGGDKIRVRLSAMNTRCGSDDNSVDGCDAPRRARGTWVVAWMETALSVELRAEREGSEGKSGVGGGIPSRGGDRAKDMEAREHDDPTADVEAADRRGCGQGERESPW
uniref:Uncharacterized protein n=1 Tax=Oryza glumipatula TaxID=40148 RepID=A0A0E0B1K6_9ORYZ